MCFVFPDFVFLVFFKCSLLAWISPGSVPVPCSVRHFCSPFQSSCLISFLIVPSSVLLVCCKLCLYTVSPCVHCPVLSFCGCYIENSIKFLCTWPSLSNKPCEAIVLYYISCITLYINDSVCSLPFLIPFPLFYLYFGSGGSSVLRSQAQTTGGR